MSVNKLSSADKPALKQPAFRLDRTAQGVLNCLRDEDIAAIESHGGMVVQRRHSVGMVALHESRKVLRPYYLHPGEHFSVDKIADKTKDKRGISKTLTQPLELPVVGLVNRPYAGGEGIKISLVLADSRNILARESREYLNKLVKVTGVGIEFADYVADIKLAESPSDPANFDAIMSILTERMAGYVQLAETDLSTVIPVAPSAPA